MNKPAGEAAAAVAAAMPDVMSPAEAATFLKVSEEDILASIKSGELKAKKIGSAYRISKGSIETFLKG
jgi:excisionase family DNA binding protein